MNNPFDALPSYIKESHKFSKFLELVNSYLLSGAIQVSLFKNAFLGDNKPNFVIEILAKQINVSVELPFVNGQPDWNTYYSQLLLAYRAKTFVTSFKGCLADFITGEPLKESCSLSVIDFSVSDVPASKSYMNVLYSVLSFNKDLTATIVRDHLIPNVTGVNESLYFSQFGQVFFGYDLDEKLHQRIADDGYTIVTDEKISLYSVGSATINSPGSGYSANDVVKATYKKEFNEGSSTVEKTFEIEFVVTNVSSGSFLTVKDPTNTFDYDPSASNVEVSGGLGSGMTIDIVGSTRKGYYIRGWDNGKFISMSQRGNE